MKETTAQRFGFGKSFQSPSAAAAVLGAALLASGTTDEAETAWSPAAACLLPDVLPVAGTLLSYGGNRQLAAGGTVTHSGNILATEFQGPSGSSAIVRQMPTGAAIAISNNAYIDSYATRHGWNNANGSATWMRLASGRLLLGATLPTDDTVSALQVNGAITASGDVTIGGIVNSTYAGGQLRFNTQNITGRVSQYFDYEGKVSTTSTGSYGWSASSTDATAAGSWDTRISRSSAGVVQLGTTSNNALGSLLCGAITASGAITGTYFTATNTGAGYGYKLAGNCALHSSAGATTLRSYSGNDIVLVDDDRLRIAAPIQDTPTQSALDPTTTNIPSGKRQGWYDSTLSEFRDWVNIGGTLLKSAAYT